MSHFVFGADGNPVQKMIDELHEPLSVERRLRVVDTLDMAMRAFEIIILTRQDVRTAIYEMQNDKVNTGHAVSRMSRSFDMKVKGASQALSTEVSVGLNKAADIEDVDEFLAIEILRDLKLDFYEVFDHESIRVLWEDDAAARNLWGNIEQCRTTLRSSVVALASNRAATRAKYTSGDVIMYEDLVMIALEGVWDAVEKFDPTKLGVQESANTFTTFVTTRVNGALSNYESENSRTVRVPRTILNRFGPLKTALDELGDADHKDLAAYATKALYEKRGGVPVPRAEAYTEEEVFELTKATQDFVSLNVEVETVSDNPSDELSLTDLVICDLPLPDQQADLNLQRERMERLIERTLSDPKDALLMKLRYCLDNQTMTYEDVSELVERQAGEKFSKTYIQRLDAELKDKLSRDKGAREIMEVYDGR